MSYYPCDKCPRNDLCRGEGCDKWKYWFSTTWSEFQSRRIVVVTTEEKRAMNYREYIFSHIFTLFWR